MGQCSECVHFSCRGDEYIENCAVCRNRSKFIKNQPEDMNDYDSYQMRRNADYASQPKEQKESKDLTLRDKFAMVALQSPSLNLTCMEPRQIARICYGIADAMLENR